jgi:hypothetical protein
MLPPWAGRRFSVDRSRRTSSVAVYGDQHAKVITGILVGFAFTHLLKGMARLVQHPGRWKVYWVQLVWVVYAFFYVVSFWWWEFWLEKLPTWSFPLYLFVIFYGVLLYLLCALLIPDDLDGYDGFRDYFYTRRQWFFGVMAAICVADFIDSMIKGREHLEFLGSEYDEIQVASLIGSIVAMKTTNARFHGAFAVISTLYQGFYYFRVFLNAR